jgi:hypothetical protein
MTNIIMATLAHGDRRHTRNNYFTFRVLPNTFNYIDVSMSVLEYKWYLSTFTFQRPSNETPWSSISRARGASFPRHSFTRSLAYGLYTWFTRHNQMEAYLGTATNKLGHMSIPGRTFETNNNNKLAHLSNSRMNNSHE